MYKWSKKLITYVALINENLKSVLASATPPSFASIVASQDKASHWCPPKKSPKLKHIEMKKSRAKVTHWNMNHWLCFIDSRGQLLTHSSHNSQFIQNHPIYSNDSSRTCDRSLDVNWNINSLRAPLWSLQYRRLYNNNTSINIPSGTLEVSVQGHSRKYLKILCSSNEISKAFMASIKRKRYHELFTIEYLTHFRAVVFKLRFLKKAYARSISVLCRNGGIFYKILPSDKPKSVTDIYDINWLEESLLNALVK